MTIRAALEARGDARQRVLVPESAHGTNPASAVMAGMTVVVTKTDAKGNIDGTSAIAWTFDRDTPYVPSPLLYDNVLYFLKTNNGLLSAFDAVSGKPHYQVQRIAKAPNWRSPTRTSASKTGSPTWPASSARGWRCPATSRATSRSLRCSGPWARTGTGSTA